MEAIEKDYLEVDTPVTGQEYCCISMVSPYSKQKCSEIAIMIRGIFATYDEAKDHIQILEKSKNNIYAVYIGQIGYWLPWNPNNSINPNNLLRELNFSMKNCMKQKIRRDIDYENRTNEMKKKAHDDGQAGQRKNIENQLADKIEQGKIKIENEQEVPDDEVKVQNENEQEVSNDDEVKVQKEEDLYGDQSDISNQYKLTNDKYDYENKWICVSFLSPVEDKKIYGIKIRGGFSTIDEAKKKAKTLRELNNILHVFVCLMGHWLKWDPDPNEIDEQDYQDKSLNDIFNSYDENTKNSALFQQHINEEENVKSIRNEVENELRNEMVEQCNLDDDQNKKEIIDNLFEK